jgi:hypothetical protein
MKTAAVSELKARLSEYLECASKVLSVGTRGMSPLLAERSF